VRSRCGSATLLVVALGSAACTLSRQPSQEPPYRPDRRDYAAFRAAWPDVLEPNYLPFMVHRIPQSGGRGDALVLCRWSDSDMPLAVHVSAPEIPDSLQDEFFPRDPAGYVDAVERALAAWERELEELVRFERVADPRQARLRIVLVAEPAPVSGGRAVVLGTTRLASACRAQGWLDDADRMRVSFEVPELRVHLADEFGLLADGQVEWIALHELGHALGMRGHSPIPADLMYEVLRDPVQVRELSNEDVNSFVSLYRLPNGTVFGRVSASDDAPRSAPGPPSGAPLLSLAPHVDPRLGFRVAPPRGWLRVDTGRGVVAVDGVTWDYTASFQVVVSRHPSIESYLDRYGNHYLRRGRLRASAFVEVNGRRALQALLETRGGQATEQITLIESGDGRIVAVTADCPTRHYEAYAPWFEASLSSLEIWDQP
jgi:predicted Zn-dependent protease